MTLRFTFPRHALLLCLLCSLPCAGSARIWKSTAGSTLEAEYAGYAAGEVTLRKPDGSEMRVPVRLLSEDDKAFVKEELKRNPPIRIADVALFPIEVEGRFGYIDVSGKVVVEPVFRKAKPFSDGLGLVRGEHPGFITVDGIPVIGVDKPGPGSDCKPFSDGVAPFREGGKWGLIDPVGRRVIKPQFHRAYSFHDGLARAMPKEGGGFGLIDKSGKYVISTGEETERQKAGGLKIDIKTTAWYTTGDCGCGVVPVGLRGEIFLADRQGKRVTPALPYQYVGQFVDGLAVCESDGKFGFIDTEGKVVIQPRFVTAHPFHRGLARVETETETAYIDKRGRIVWKAGK